MAFPGIYPSENEPTKNKKMLKEKSNIVNTKNASQPPRAQFTTGLGVLFATLGSAVGLGNIWKFPSLAGSNGGAAFLILYILCTLLIGIPIMVVEQMLGREGRGDAVTTLRRLAPKQLWWLIGAGGILAAFLIMAFYTEVAGWVFAYIIKSASGALLSTNPEVTSAAFADLVSSPWLSLIVQWVVLAVTGTIILFGVTKGIEATTKRLMPLLFILLIVVGVRSLTLPGASEGLAFLFKPDFSKITGPVILAAMGLAFFKLSIGMGCMITYGSYFGKDQDIPLTATRVAFSDLTISILAGIAIFPAVFAYGFEPASGPSLLFITIPAVFASMPMGSVFMTIFFILTAIASIGAMLSLIEVIVSWLETVFSFSRARSTLLTILALALVGSTAALSNSAMAEFKLFGMTMFDLFDYVSSNLLLPLGGLFLSLFAVFAWGFPRFKQSLSNQGTLVNKTYVTVLYAALMTVTPISVLIILLTGLKLI